jgi:hypothetical protein
VVTVGAPRGRVHCPVCDRSVDAKLVIRRTRAASFVSFNSHTSKPPKAHGRCKGGKIGPTGKGFPSWARSALDAEFDG